MKRIAFLLSFIAFIFISCNNETKTESTTKDTTAATTPEAPPMDSAAMAQAWQNFMTPGDMHKWMAKHAGTWEAEISSYMSGPL